MFENNKELISSKNKTQIDEFRKLLASKVETRISNKTGIITTRGIPGKRVWIEDFKFDKSVDASTFEVTTNEWIDKTARLISDSETLEDLVILSHFPSWLPGQPKGDSDSLLVNINSGKTLRVPCVHVVGSSCFGKDRNIVYTTSAIPNEGVMGLVKIDLRTGENTRIGGPEVQSGISMFPKVSPDGKRIAVLRLDPTAGPLKSQLYIVDVESESTTPLGKPLDTAFVTWLPDSHGLVLVSREYETLSSRTVSTVVCRIDLNGTLNEIIEGEFPAALSDGRILYREHDSKLWHTCDLKGENTRKVGDGLKGFAWSAVSPNRKRALMMKFGKLSGPRPYVVDLATGKAKELPVSGYGLWAQPVW